VVSLNTSSTPGAIIIDTGCVPATDLVKTALKWTLKPVTHGFEIVNQGYGLCLDVTGSSKASSAPVIQEACSGKPSQIWNVTASGAAYQFVNSNSSLCLMEGIAAEGNTTLVQGACAPVLATSTWVFSSGLAMPSTVVNLLQANSGQCLNNQGSTVNDAAILQKPCSGPTGIAAEQWLLKPTGAAYQVVSVSSGLCLSESENSPEFGTAIVQAACSDATGQLWQPTPIGGLYQLGASNSTNQCLVVSDRSRQAAAPMVLCYCQQARAELWAINIANIPSAWSDVIPLPIIPIGVANLPDGNLLLWSADQLTKFIPDAGKVPSQTYTAIFNPTTNKSEEILETNLLTDMFCPGTAQLPDGRIMLNGGSSSYATSIYDPSIGEWVADALMNIPRGYNGSTLLSNGSVFTLGGSFDGPRGGKTGEVWTEGEGWRKLSGVPDWPITGPDPEGVYRGDNHGWFFAMGGGQVFHAGPSAEMHWITTTGTGSITSMGLRGNDTYSINGKAVMYDVGRIFKTGGGQAYSGGAGTFDSYDIVLNDVDSNQGVTVTEVAPMAYRRSLANGVLLPDGEIFIVGGQTQVKLFSDVNGVLIPEMWTQLPRSFVS